MGITEPSFFSPIGLKFYITVGRTRTLYRVDYGSNDYFVTKLDYWICPGISIIKLGLHVYFGKNNYIIFTPIYIFADYFLVSIIPNNILYGVNYTNAFQFGFGLSLKFKIGKKIILES